MMIVKSHSFEIERIEWLLANGHPNYALWRCLKLLVRQRKELVVLKWSNAIVYAYLYRHHVMLELSIRQQLPIIWDFVAGRFRRASPLTRPDGGGTCPTPPHPTPLTQEKPND